MKLILDECTNNAPYVLNRPEIIWVPGITPSNNPEPPVPSGQITVPSEQITVPFS